MRVLIAIEYDETARVVPRKKKCLGYGNARLRAGTETRARVLDYIFEYM